MKVKIRPVLLKEELCFQAEEQVGAQAFHRNLNRGEAAEYVTEKLEQAFRQSTFCWFGYENGQLIAVARAISDCTWSSYLADVAIVPARQGQGYGQQLMLAIREQLLPFGKIFIYAVADKITFYQRFGFAMLTTGMVCASEEGMQKMQEQGYIRQP